MQLVNKVTIFVVLIIGLMLATIVSRSQCTSPAVENSIAVIQKVIGRIFSTYENGWNKPIAEAVDIQGTLEAAEHILSEKQEISPLLMNISMKFSIEGGDVTEDHARVLQDELTKGYGLVEVGKIEIDELLKDLANSLSHAEIELDCAGRWFFASSVGVAGAVASPFTFGVSPLIAIPFGATGTYFSYSCKATQWKVQKLITVLENLQQRVVDRRRQFGEFAVTLDGWAFELKYRKAQVSTGMPSVQENGIRD